MIAVSFKLVVLVVLGAFIAAVALAVAWDRWASRRQRLGGWGASQFPSAFEAAPFGLLLVRHPDHELLYANQNARRILGLAQPSGPLPPAAWRSGLVSDLATAQGSPGHTHYRVFSVSDDQHLSWWIYHLAESEVGAVFVLDLSQQRRLESASRLFLSTLSHELRTPLTAILAHVEVLRRADISASVQEVSLNLIHHETHRLARLVQDLLTLNRLETIADLAERPINLLLLVEEAISEVFPLCESRQLSISLEADSPLGLVRGNEDYLKRAILNVLDNALKYCRPGDEIKVAVKNDPGGVLCQVADTGPGIPEEHLPHLARRFYRVNKTVEGSGLGLSLVEEILRRHNSQLVVESRSDGDSSGTIVRFLLPPA